MIIVMRPPGTWTLYHHFENPLFTRVLEFFARDQNTTIIFLPRILKQAEAVTALKHGNIVIPGSSLDGPNLMHHADIVVGGGGSMNREAAVLGANTFSLYAGRLAAVDRYLIRKGLMTHIRSIDDIKGITICKTPGKATNKRRPELIQQTAKAFLSGRKR